MKKLAILAVGTLLSVAASAQLNAFAVQNGWNNNTGTFSYSGTFPSVTMSIVNQNNTALNNYGDRFIAWLSADGGVTRAKIDGHKDFSLFYTLKLNTDAAATREVEAGLLFQYGVRNPGPNEYYPTSQYYAKFSPFNGNSTIQTSGDWVLPGYNFVDDGATIARNDVVTMGIEYDYNDATPSASLQRLTFTGADAIVHQTPWTNGNWGGPVYDPAMELGIYFQPLVEAANPTHNSSAVINLVSFTGTIVGAPSSTVSGNVGLSDWSGAVNGRTVSFKLYTGTTLAGSATGTLNSSGNYTFSTTVANGTYTLLADAGRGWLSRKRSITIAAGTATGANFTLPNGDISNDGVIDLTDYTRLAVAFNAVPSSGNWDADADVNGDGVVDLTDYTAVVVNFNGLDETP